MIYSQKPEESFDLELCVTSGQVFRWEKAFSGAGASRAAWFGVDGDHWFLVTQQPNGDLFISGNEESTFTSLFSLDRPWGQTTAELVDRGQELKPIIARLGGLRIMNPTSVAETLFCFMCTSNNHLARIAQMVRRLGEYGEVMADIEGHLLRRFPSVETIASLTEEELRAKGFGYRGRSIPMAARQIVAKERGWLESLKTLLYEEAKTELCTLYGIGPKLADCIALYGLGRHEAVPFDTHLWQAVTELYFPEWRDQPLTSQRYKFAGDFLRDRFGEYAGLAHLYLYLGHMKGRKAP